MATKPILRAELSELPPRMQGLPIDERGYPVPWFVAWVDGKPEFRAMDGEKFARAIRERRCWVCGNRLGSFMAFAVGPMCLVNMTNSEPPSHVQCALWSAQNCPFLARPHMIRRDGGLPEIAQPAAGVGIERNPGAVAVYITKKPYHVREDGITPGRYLITMPVEHESVVWFSEGRPATRAEVEHSIVTGLPYLIPLAEQDGPEAVKQLHASVERVVGWLPKE